MSAKYYRPSEIIAKIGKVAYKLALPMGSRVHPVFHVSQLKKKISKKRVPIHQLPYADHDGQIRVEPIDVVDRRVIKRANKPVVQWLIQWANAAPEDATWEDASFI